MKLAVFFPGIGYHCDKPLLYFSREAALETGYDNYINVNYTGFRKDAKQAADGMEIAFRTAMEQTEQILSDVDWNEYDDIVFISKSIGTAIAASYAKEHNISCRNVYYTPLERTFEFDPQPGIAFTGTKDSWVNVDAMIALYLQNHMPYHIIENANHSLEVKNDVITNLGNLKKIMEITRKYLKAGSV